MSDYVGVEAKQARENGSGEISSETSTTEGVSRKIVARFLSEADEDLQNAVLEDAPDCTLFDTSAEISLVANQEEYDLPADVYADGELRLVQYSPSGLSAEYERLDPIHYVELDSYPSSDVCGYVLRGNKLRVSPPRSSSTGKLRIFYPRQLDELKLRAGQIDTNNNTTITLEANGDNTNVAPSADVDALNDAEFICVVDRNGVVQHSALPVSSFSDITNIITGTFTGLTFTAGHYVVVGPYATTHSALPRMCKRYRINYAAMRLQMKKSDSDLSDTAALLGNMRTEIVSKLVSRSGGVKRPPQDSGFERW